MHQEIAETLRRKLVVIPVSGWSRRKHATVAAVDELPRGIRDVVFHQKHDVTHERFGRDIAELIEAITIVRRKNRPRFTALHLPWSWVGFRAVSIVIVYAVSYDGGVSPVLRWTLPTEQAKARPDEVAANASARIAR